MNTNISQSEKINFQQIKEHYEIEKNLAHKLLNASKEERQHLYNELYDQLFKLVPHHPQLQRKIDSKASSKEVNRKMQLVERFLTQNSIFLEVGPGDCHFAFEVAKQVQRVYAVDVTSEVVKNSQLPENFELIISDGSTIPVDKNTVTIAYSNQLMEHLHPEDALEQIQNIYQALTTGGIYICITPNRLSGPHDISKYFDEVSTGFHLQEYTHTDLSKLFSDAGFSQLKSYIGGAGYYVRFPMFLIKLLEKILDSMQFSWRKKVARALFSRALLGVIIVATK